MVRYRPVTHTFGYRVGDDGSVWSHRRKRFWYKLKPQIVAEGGALSVNLGGRGCLVHRLVLQAFIGPCPDGMEGCHNDGNPKNNNLYNLRWDTHVNNIRDKEKHGTGNKGDKHGNSKLTTKRVLKMRRLHATGRYTLRQLAERFVVTRAAVSAICRRKRWTHV